MTGKEKKKLEKIIKKVNYGKIIINKKAGKIINVKKITSLKLNN
jgi:peptidase E